MPCPFCGMAVEYLDIAETDVKHGYGEANCPLSGRFMGTIEQWNTRAARPTTDVSTDVLERLRALVAFMDLNRIAMLGAGEGHRIIANDLRSLIEGREALQRSNAEKDEALRQIATVSAKTEYAHQLRDIARKALSHSSEQTHD